MTTKNAPSAHWNDPEKIPFTQQAYDKLQQEFDRLTELREEVLIRLEEARQMGDLSENGAYKYAKSELRDIDRKLRQLKIQRRFGYVVKNKKSNGVIDFGSSVTLKNDTHTITFMLVSEFESDPEQKKLSTKSPMGKAVVGKKFGDEVVVETPAGKTEYMIEKVA